MTDTLATFAEQVTNVAREVGVEGRLGGQANVPGAAGTWKDLTGNVNLLAANLTNQVRAIAEVATAVTKGDLTRSIQVEARGEVAELKDNINTMIDNLRETTERNQEQDWLKTNLAKFTAHAAGPARPGHGRQAAAVGAGAAGQRAAGRDLPDAERRHRQRAGAVAARQLCAAATTRRSASRSARAWSASARSRSSASCSPTCRADYARIHSSLGAATPKNIVVLPVLFEGETKAVIELASLQPFTADAPDLPRAAHAVHRRRAQHDRSDDADRGPAAAVAAAHGRAADAADRAAADQRGAGARRPSSSPSRTPRSSARTRKSSRRAARSRKRRPSWR